MRNGSGNREWIDSNVLVHAFHHGSPKHDAAMGVLDRLVRNDRGVIGAQNLAEFSNVLRHKSSEPAGFGKIRQYVQHLKQDFHCFGYTGQTVVFALDLSERHSVHFFDALLAATMFENGIDTIYTENVEDFGKIPGIKAVNPFD
ncbi:PIN domain-containing protein [Candidatus Micrarchaeota archaeon]|nr:PIN domain-containing protein [Candidatus Micrarchaeota archaeon]